MTKARSMKPLERWQWVANRDGGQFHGNELEIRLITPADYDQIVRYVLRPAWRSAPRTFERFRYRHPGLTHYAVQRTVGIPCPFDPAEGELVGAGIRYLARINGHTEVRFYLLDDAQRRLLARGKDVMVMGASFVGVAFIKVPWDLKRRTPALGSLEALRPPGDVRMWARRVQRFGSQVAVAWARRVDTPTGTAPAPLIQAHFAESVAQVVRQ